MERSFIFKVVSKGAQILREDFADALKVHIKLEEVLYLGTLGRPDTWHCTVQNIDTKTALLVLGELVVCGRKVYVQESDHLKNRLGYVSHVPVRVHWNSIHLPLELVPAMLDSYGEIVKDEFERSYQESPFPGALTGVRKMVFKTIDREGFLEECPHIIEPMYDGRTYRLLVMVTGRPAMCLKCEKMGHKSWECPETKFCKSCRKWGHVTCPKHNTYASKLQRKPAEEEPEVLEIEEEEQVEKRDEAVKVKACAAAAAAPTAAPVSVAPAVKSAPTVRAAAEKTVDIAAPKAGTSALTQGAPTTTPESQVKVSVKSDNFVSVAQVAPLAPPAEFSSCQQVAPLAFPTDSIPDAVIAAALPAGVSSEAPVCPPKHRWHLPPCNRSHPTGQVTPQMPPMLIFFPLLPLPLL